MIKITLQIITCYLIVRGAMSHDKFDRFITKARKPNKEGHAGCFYDVIVSGYSIQRDHKSVAKKSPEVSEIKIKSYADINKLK
ncbi:hypothetical protein J6590_019561 [Homalodisca vitripennis]|nr:hypothetical protein J6590_019561 [Homalodisca vitripennis]